MTATVLVVDDADDMRFVIRLALERAGYVVKEARHGGEGLELLETEGPDVVLLDLRMPGLSGWDVLDKIAESQRAVRILVVSAHASAEAFEGAVRRGCVGYVVKPFEVSELVTKLREALAEDPRRISA